MSRVKDFENKIYPQLRNGFQEALNEMNLTPGLGKLFRPVIEKNGYKHIIEKIKQLETFTLHSLSIEQMKMDWWKEYLQSRMYEENGKIKVLDFENKEITFESTKEVYEKFIKAKNDKIWEPYHNVFTRIFVEFATECIIMACEDLPIQTSIEFLRKSILYIQKEQALDKYAKRKLNEHLKYYKTILHISLKDRLGNKNLYKSEALYSSITQNDKLSELRKNLEELNFENFFNLIKSIYAGIPYNLTSAKESYFHSIFHVIITLLIQSISSEEATSLGRIDSIIEIKDKIFIFEFKLTSAENALEQIHNKKYYHKYENSNKEIHLLGVCFDIKLMNIKNWLTEKV